MSYETIRDALEARINTVSNVGVVSDYRRGITNYLDFEAAFVDTISGNRQVRAWTIGWESGRYERSSVTATGVRMRGPQTFVVYGYMSKDDKRATDREFSALVRDVALAVATTGATITPKQGWVPVEIRTNGFAQLEAPAEGIVLVHYAEIALTIEDEQVVANA